MKVLGISKEGAEYICSISHTELEKFLDLYYDKLKTLKVGDEVDLAKGHDFAKDAKDALKQTEQFFNSHQKIVKAITDGISLFKIPHAEETRHG